MSPVVSLILSLIALTLALVAIALATIANRRWARRDGSSRAREPAPGTGNADEPPAGTGLGDSAASSERDPRKAALVELRDHLDSLGLHVADLRDRVDGISADVGGVRSELDGVVAAVDRVREAPAHDPNALRHVALVRYDAFADVGGRLSYSVALLDDTRSGLVLTTLAGKADVRTYVRTVSAGQAEGTLTAEEQQAVAAATAPGTSGSRP